MRSGALGLAARSLAAAALVTALVGCERDDPGSLTPSGGATGGNPTGSGAGGHSGTGSAGIGGSTGEGGAGGSAVTTVLDERVLSYTEALRSASFKIIGNAPTLQQMMDIDRLPTDAEKEAKYTEIIDSLMINPEFARQMIALWRDALRMRGNPAGVPSREAAPVFAARLVVEQKNFTDLVLASTATCPTFVEPDGLFTDGECNNGVTPSGILTDPGAQSLYYGNLAFLRNRFYHEVLTCRSALEPVAEPGQVAGPDGPPGYASPWPWFSITGGPTANVDFLHDNGTICANCHATWNHRAPLWGNFDADGMYQATIAVHLPTVGLPLASRTDWLPDNESTAWKYGTPAATLAELGQAIANDPEFHYCTVARMWNWAMSRGDMVETGVKVSDTVMEPIVKEYVESGYNLRKTLRSIFLHPDFVRF